MGRCLTPNRRVPHHRSMARPGSSMAMPRRPRFGRSWRGTRGRRPPCP